MIRVSQTVQQLLCWQTHQQTHTTEKTTSLRYHCAGDK